MSKSLLAVLCIYLTTKAIESFLLWLNLRHLKLHGAEVPPAFVGQIEVNSLEQMRSYTLARSRVQVMASSADVIITILFLFGPFLNRFNTWINSYNLSFTATALLFFLLLMLAEIVLKIPFDVYMTFRVEQRFGFNTQTVSLWCIDLLKAVLLSTLLYGLLIGGFFRIVQFSPQYWWLIGWLFLFSFTVFMLYLSPYVIEPLFNKFSPIANPELEKKIKHIMAKGGIAVERVFAMDASKRSKHSNAYFSGIGRVKRIVLFDTLLQSNSDEEIIGILAHEAGHWKMKHIIKRLAVMECLALAGMYLAFLLTQSDSLALLFGLSQPAFHAKLLLTGFIGSLIVFPFKPLSSWISRRHENEADEFAVQLTGDPEHLAQALIKLGRENLANLHPHPWYAAFYYSHPPLVQRLANLKGLKKIRAPLSPAAAATGESDAKKTGPTR